MDDYAPEQEHDEEDDEIIVEAYCVSCRESIEMENPTPVWTRKGLPATRGTCPDCGGVVFRLGKSDAHRGNLNRPAAVKVAQNSRASDVPQPTVYINFALEDRALAEQISADLERLGVACWLHEHEAEDVQWAEGVHPSLTECKRMIYILSEASLAAEGVKVAWEFFRAKKKPVVIALTARLDPPDDLRRSPRFDFSGDYKSALRQMMQALHPS